MGVSLYFNQMSRALNTIGDNQKAMAADMKAMADNQQTMAEDITTLIVRSKRQDAVLKCMAVEFETTYPAQCILFAREGAFFAMSKCGALVVWPLFLNCHTYFRTITDYNRKMFRVVLILQCLAFTEAFVSYPSSVALSKKCVGIMPLKKPSGMQVSHSP